MTTQRTYTLTLRYSADDENHATRIGDALYDAAGQDAEAGGFKLDPRHSVDEAPDENPGPPGRTLVDLYDELVDWADAMGYDYETDPCALKDPRPLRGEACIAIARLRDPSPEARTMTVREIVAMSVLQGYASNPATAVGHEDQARLAFDQADAFLHEQARRGAI